MSERVVVFVAPWDGERLFAPIRVALESRIGAIRCAYVDMLVGRPDAPADWSLDSEVHALRDSLSALGEPQPHIVGFSGGAAVALALAASLPGVAASLTLMEPPWAGNDEWGDAERRFREDFEKLRETPPDQAWETIVRALNRADVPTPPAPAMPPAILKAGFERVWHGYLSASLDRAALARFDAPVLLPVGERSAPRMHAQAALLEGVFPRSRTLLVAGAGHFDLPFTGADPIGAELSGMISQP